MLFWIVQFLYIINLIVWVSLLSKKQEGKGILNTLFPFFVVFNRHNRTGKDFAISGLILYLEVSFLNDLLLLITGGLEFIYLCFFSIILILELYIVFRVLCSLIGCKIWLIVVFIPLALVSAVIPALYSVYKSNQLVNFIDFILLVTKIFGSFVIISVIINKKIVRENVDMVVIIGGFLIFFVSQVFVTGFMADNYLNNWLYNQLSMILTLCVWFGGSLICRKLQ